MHILIFVGWMGLFALSGLMFFIEITHMVGIEIMDPETFRNLLQFPNQVLGYILFFGVLIALVRRIIIPKVRQNTNSYDSVLIVTLFIVVVTGFIAHAGRYIATGITDFTGLDMLFLDYKIWTLGGMPIFLTYVKELALFHSLLALFVGFSFIPFSKYIHMITSPLTMILNKGGEK
jgi:heterodisulfide reductase subunit E